MNEGYTLGTQLAACTLVAPSAPQTRLARVWLSPELLYSLRLESGSVVAVSLASPSSPSTPLLLEDAFSSKFNLDIDYTAHYDIDVGRYAVLAEAWPLPKLKGSNAAVSLSLSNSLAQPNPGDTVLLFAQGWMRGAQPVECVHLRLSYEKGTGASAVLLQLQDNLEFVHGRSSPSKAATPPSGRRRAVGGTGGGSSSAIPKSPPTDTTSIAKQPAKNSSHVASLLRACFENDGESDGSRVRKLLRLVAHQHLYGHRLIAGNYVAVPLLGAHVLFMMDGITSGGRQCPVFIGKDTKVIVSAADFNQHPIPDGPRTNKHAYDKLAAKAAHAKLGGGEDGAAALAAGRAALLGQRSLGEQSFDSIGGSSAQVKLLQQLVSAPLRESHLYAHYQISPATGVLMHGPPGTGKTLLARAAAADAHAKLFVINGPDVLSEYFGESELGLRGIFAAAAALAPSVIFIDEIDALAPSREGRSSGGINVRLVASLVTEMDALKGFSVVVLAATNRLSSIDLSLRRPGRFDREIEVGVPSPAERGQILRKMLRNIAHSLSDSQVDKIAESTHGYVGADISALCTEAGLAALKRGMPSRSLDLFIVYADFISAEKKVQASAMREVAIEIPKVSWSDIGGLEDVKQKLKEAVEWPTLFPDALKRLNANPPQGILLFGPPGCSKTLLARAVAAESRYNFISIKGPELYSKYVGESEKAVAELFKRARAASPSVIFFDEIDGLVTSRGGGQSGVDVSHRVLSQLLQEMDGLQARSSQPLIVIGATNRPDYLDEALLRPGRFDRLVLVPPPDVAARAAIFSVHTRAIQLAQDVDLQELAQCSAGFSGADIASVCQAAALMALDNDHDAEVVPMRYFSAAIEDTVTAINMDSSWLQKYSQFAR